MLRKKLYRDLRLNLSQFFVIFIMVMLAVMSSPRTVNSASTILKNGELDCTLTA